jgi:hypothetical protein
MEFALKLPLGQIETRTPASRAGGRRSNHSKPSYGNFEKPLSFGAKM